MFLTLYCIVVSSLFSVMWSQFSPPWMMHVYTQSQNYPFDRMNGSIIIKL